MASTAPATTLPLLHPVRGPATWVGADMAGRESEWRFDLSAGEIAELERAVARVEAEGRDLLAVTRDDFPLPLLGPRLATMRQAVLQGRGFATLCGLPVRRLGRRGAAVAFWGIGTHSGETVPQNAQGHVLGHVKDLGLDYADPIVRGYQTRARLPYHTDYGDVAALLCLRAAPKGGLSSLVSSVTLYNEMLRRAPDLARVLTGPYYKTRWGEFPSPREAFAGVPIFNPVPGGMATCYVRSAVRKAQTMPEVPRLTPLQVQAMDALDALAADPALHLDMALAEGAMQFVNNHWVLHSRTDFEDAAEPDERRHMLRLWFACDDGPPVPQALIEGFQGATAGGRPAGIRVPGVAPNATIDS
ncbi:MAG: hypothetical protein EXQ96_03800 [Alphaproteobacteria bacterium]|nr:hypothetical protein [Alphaproteobacteria bacterium]